LVDATVLHRGSGPADSVRVVTTAQRIGDRQRALELIHQRNDASAARVLFDGRSSGIVERQHFAAAHAQVEHESRNSVTVHVANSDAERETLVVFARPWYPGYRATFNGVPVRVEQLDLILPAVCLPKGQSGQLILEYCPTSLIAGLGVAGVTGAVVLVLLVLSVLIWIGRSRKSGPRAEQATEHAP
jgi:hypothetical protein